MRALQVFAIRAKLFPDESYSVEANYFNALIGEKQHLFCHAIEYGGVGVIQVPLIGVKGCPHPAAIFE